MTCKRPGSLLAQQGPMLEEWSDAHPTALGEPSSLSLLSLSLSILPSREYSSEWKPGDEPYYPVNDDRNGALYQAYKRLADVEEKVIFGGRLGEYKYYDMDAVIASALEKCKELF